MKNDKVIIGEERYLYDGQIEYHFTEIPAGEYLYISIPKKVLLSDLYYYDVDLKKYTHLEKTKRNRKSKVLKPLKLKQLNDLPTFDEVIIELAVYDDIDLFLEQQISETLNYKFIGFGYFLSELDEAASKYNIISCTLNLKDILDNSRL